MYFFGLKGITTKLLYVKPGVASCRAQPAIRAIPGICDAFWQLWHFLTLSDCQTPPSEKFPQEGTFSWIPARSSSRGCRGTFFSMWYHRQTASFYDFFNPLLALIEG